MSTIINPRHHFFRWMGQSILWVIMFLLFSDAVADSTTVKQKMGFTLFNPVYEINALEGWVEYGLTSSQRNLLNISNSADLLSSEISFHAQKLGVHGRENALSSNGVGAEGTRLEWRGRPMRNPRNCRADFNRIAPLSIGGVRSSSNSMLSGVIGTGGVVEFSPLSINTDEPVTTLHHRDGYYGFEPVEFIHARRISSGTSIVTGGYFSKTAGKIEHSRHEGHIVWGELNHQITKKSKIALTLMNRGDKTGISMTGRTINFNDNDWDLEYNLAFNDSSKLKVSGYKTWRTEDDSTFHDYAQEAGVDISFFDNDFLFNNVSIGGIGADLRIGRMDIEFPAENNVLLTEIEGSLGWRDQYKNFSLWAIAGCYGWGPERIGLTGNAGAEYKTNRLGSGYINISQAVNPHSPEIMFADFKEERPTDDLNLLWRNRPELPIKGRILPVTISINQELGWKYSEEDPKWFNYLSDINLDISVFRKEIQNPAVWTVENNNLLIPFTAQNRLITGWKSNLRLKHEQYRGSFSIIGLSRGDLAERGVPVISAEPTIRLNWECGWHIVHWGEDFEGDVSFSGQWFNSFLSYEPGQWERLGGAYPLDFKLQMRIYGFTLYWGLHNWNSFNYHLVSGYQMIHKEEYFGIHWLLFN